MMDLESKVRLGHFDKELDILRSIADETFYDSRVKLLKDFCANDIPVLKDKSVKDKKKAVSFLDDRCDVPGLLNSTLDVQNEVLSIFSLFGYDNPLNIYSSNNKETDISRMASFLSKLMGIKYTKIKNIFTKKIFSTLFNNDFSKYIALCYDNNPQLLMQDLESIYTKNRGAFLEIVSNMKNFKKYQLDFLSYFKCDNPINISSHNDSHTGTSNLGAFYGKILDIKDKVYPKSVQKAVFKQLYDDDFVKYLDSCYQDITSLISDIENMPKNTRTSFLSVLTGLSNFSAYKHDFLQYFKYHNPVNISNSNKGVGRIGRFMSRLLGIKSSTTSGPIQKAIFTQLYDDDLNIYLNSCYGGSIEALLSDVKKLNTASKGKFLDHISNLKNFDGFKRKLLCGLNYDNPMQISAVMEDKTGLNNIAGYVSKILGISFSTGPIKIQKAIFSQLYDNNFKKFLDSCYDGKIKEFIFDVEESHKNSNPLFLDVLVSLNGFDSFRKDFINHFEYMNPITISSRNDIGTGTQIIGKYISRILKIKSTSNPNPIKKALFEKIHDNDFEKYLASCYDSNIDSFKKDLQKLKHKNLSSFWRMLQGLDNFSQYEDSFSESICYYKNLPNVKKGIDIIIGELGSFPSLQYVFQKNSVLANAIKDFHKGMAKVKIKLGYADKELDILKQVVDEVYDGS